ncbi:MAG TPA: glycosyltransferase family 1 protein [Gaiellaceae bacterium]|nr:glycosyltransferase family 1 protein [Gaiellaceae bacterium]
MRIVFDVSPLALPRTGVGNYVLGSLRGLVEAAGGEDEVVAFALTGPRGRRAIPEALGGLQAARRLVFVPGARWVREAWSAAGRPSVERVAGRVDVFHFSDWMFPAQRGGLRSTMVHDLIPLRFPEWTTAWTRRMHGAKYRNAARTCDLVFTNSCFTAGDVRERLGVPEERLVVAPPGVDPVFRPEGPRADLGRPYALTVATLEPRKNLDTLVEAWRRRDGDLALAVVGAEGWGEQPELDVPGVLRLGYVAGERLAELYRGAEVAVYPSRFEGFGMPVVEAMACGTAVVASAHPSLDEAGGEVAVRADPDDPDAIVAAVAQALAERERLVALGLEHARGFTWRRVGEIMRSAYRARL